VRWLIGQIDEIRSDPALTYYGAALALANVFTAYQWQYRAGVPQLIGGNAAPLCWPFWENCRAIVSVSGVNRILWAYLLLSIAGGIAFVLRRVGTGYALLLAVNVVRTIVMVQDYRLRANQHYMLNWIVLAFLFIPGKRALLHHVLVSLYFWAGVLKLDWEWLSGTALYSQGWIPAALVPASCVYVVLLETTLVFGTYAQRPWMFWATTAQLVAFHIVSWPIVGFWYPLLMFCLLAILPLERLLHPPHEWVTFESLSRFRRFRPGIAAAAVIALLAALQFVPRLFPGDSAITGEGRVFALHMFDALIECDATMTYHFADGTERTDALSETQRLPHRSRCDPVIYFDLAKNWCRALGQAQRRPQNGAVDVDLRLRSKHTSEASYHPIIDVAGFCAANPRYDMLRHNAWIHPVQEASTAAWRR